MSITLRETLLDNLLIQFRVASKMQDVHTLDKTQKWIKNEILKLLEGEDEIYENI